MAHYIRYLPRWTRQRRFVPSKTAVVIEAIAGTSNGAASVTGVLVGDGALIGAGAGTATVSGVLTGDSALIGNSTGLAATSAVLTANGALIGDTAGSASVVGTLRASIEIAGSSDGLASADALVLGKGYLQGSASGSATGNAVAQQPDGVISGTATGIASSNAALFAVGYLSAVAFGTASLSASLHGRKEIAGNADGVATVEGTLSFAANLEGAVTASSSVTATLHAVAYLAGSALGLSSASAVSPEIVEVEDSVPMLSAGIWRKNQPNTILFVLTDENGEEVTGLGSTFTLRIRKVGGSFVTGAGTKSEIGLGWYQYVSTAGEASVSGPVAIVVTHASIDQQNLEYVVEDRVVNAVPFTYTLTSTVGSAPIAGADISFSIDSNPANSVWSGITDAFGVARDLNGNLPRLTPGTYSVFRYKPSYVFSDPDIEVVS